MARIDDYQQARDLAAKALAQRSTQVIAAQSGIAQWSESRLILPFLNRVYQISHPGFAFEDTAEPAAAVPIQEQVLILHYLDGAGGVHPTGRWIAYREIPGAAFYYAAFVKRAIDPLKKVFGNQVEGLRKAATTLGATPVAAGDAGFELCVFPKVPLQLILYAGDEEFAPEANILFDSSVGEILSPEDAAWLAGMVVYRLVALAR
jgi:hypothetical protein